MINFIKSAFTKVLALVTIPFITITSTHAGTLDNSTSFFAAWPRRFTPNNI